MWIERIGLCTQKQVTFKRKKCFTPFPHNYMIAIVNGLKFSCVSLADWSQSLCPAFGFRLLHLESFSPALHPGQTKVAHLRKLSSRPFHDPTPTNVDVLHRPLSRQKPSFHPLMAGRNCFLWHRDAISWVRASQKRLLCVGSRWGEKRWPLSPALISTTFLKINGSCGITLPYTWRGTDGAQTPDIEFFLHSLVQNPIHALIWAVKGCV